MAMNVSKKGNKLTITLDLTEPMAPAPDKVSQAKSPSSKQKNLIFAMGSSHGYTGTGIIVNGRELVLNVHCGVKVPVSEC